MAKKKQGKKAVRKAAAKKVKKVATTHTIRKGDGPLLPLGDRVLLQDLGEMEVERTTASGIIIPESTDKDTGGKRGKVVAVGNGRIEHGERIPLSVSVGDTVLYQWGDKIKIGSDEYIIVRESEIIALFN